MINSIGLHERLGKALLMVTVILPVAGPMFSRQAPTAVRESFEVASIRLSGPLPTGGRGGSALDFNPCAISSPQIAPNRFFAPNATLIRLISWAYVVKDCRVGLGFISGGPAWIRSDRYDVQAVIPEGSPRYGRQQLNNGEALKLQEMIQTLLIDRFKLALHREMKEMAVYNLVVAKPGKFKTSEDQTPPPDPYGPQGGIRLGPGGVPPRGMTLFGNGLFQGTSISMSTLAQSFQERLDRPVIDKTNLKGYFDIHVPIESDPGSLSNTYLQVLDSLGLKLESSRASVEVIVVDHVERPSEN